MWGKTEEKRKGGENERKREGNEDVRLRMPDAV